MTNTILIEQTAKTIKLVEAIVLAVLFSSIAAGLGGMYLSLALDVAMFIIAGIALIGFMVVRVWRWWMHGRVSCVNNASTASSGMRTATGNSAFSISKIPLRSITPIRPAITSN